MPARNRIEAQARVMKTLKGGMLEVELDNGFKALVYVSGKMKMNKIKVIEGDIVTVELCPYDLSRGRVVFRRK